MMRPLILAVVLAVPAAFAQPADPADGLGAGAPLPEAGRSLQDVSGRSLTLGGSAGPSGLVVAFWSNTCPWAERNAARLADLGREYGPAGIAFVAIGADDGAGTAGASAQQVAASLGVPYVADPGGALARAFGVRSLPTAFYFSGDGRLVYEGAIDDSPADADAVDVPYLRQAMDQHLANVPVEVQRTAPLGCALRDAR
jgi:hypothetical protein